MSSKFDQIRPCSVELAALEHLKKIFYFLENYPKYFYDMLALRLAIVALWSTCLYQVINDIGRVDLSSNNL